MKKPDPPDLMLPCEVAALFRVDSKTVTRWATSGKIPPDKIIRTLGGVRRYDGAYIRGLVNGQDGTS